jgi:hypothetical protein
MGDENEEVIDENIDLDAIEEDTPDLGDVQDDVDPL